MKPLPAAWAGALAVLCLESLHNVADAWIAHNNSVLSSGNDVELFSSSPISMLEVQWGEAYKFIIPYKTANGYEFLFDTNLGSLFDIRRDSHSHCAVGGVSFASPETTQSGQKTGVASVDDCQQECHSNSSCIAAHYHPRDRTCRFFIKIGGVTEDLHTAIVLPTCNPACFEEQRKFNGKQTSLGFAPNALICQAMCRSDSACQGFSWNKITRQCFQFGNDATLTNDDNHVSGRRDICSGLLAPTAPGNSIYSNTASSADHFSLDRSVDSYQRCRIQCLAIRKCLSYDYNSQRRYCYLKEARGTRSASSGVVTGTRFNDASCYTKGYILTGSTYSTIKDANHPSECHTECYGKADCQRWTYNPQNKTCYLFSKTKDIATKLMEGAYWGPKEPCNNDAAYNVSDPGCGRRGVKYGVTPFESTSAGDPSSCQSKCAANSNCQVFVYDSFNRQCHFHLAEAVRHQQNHDKYFSGPKRCSDCQVTNSYYSGEQVGEFDNVETAEECQLHCQATQYCAFWSYTVDSKECTFYKEGAVTKSGKNNIIGPKYCDGAWDLRYAQAATPSFGFSQNVGKKSLQDCRNACKNNKNCVTFTHRLDTTCTLSDGTNLRNLASHNHVAFLVGFRQSASCIQQGVGYVPTKEALLWSLTANHSQECQERCNLMEECTFFSYNVQSRQCSLLSGKTDEEVNYRLVSGPAQCVPDTSCVLKDVGLTDADTISTDLARSLEVCQDRCKEDVNCKFFTYESARKQCTLKSGGLRWKDDLRTKSQKGFMTGTKKCMPDGDDKSVCDTHDYAFYGKELDPGKPVAAENVKECRRTCLKEPRCRFWVYNKAEKQCNTRALNGPGARSPFVPDDNLFAGSREGCPRCLRQGVTYSGKTLTAIQLQSEATCAQGCEAVEECVGFSFAKQVCTFFKEVTGMVSAGSDTVSGPKRC